MPNELLGPQQDPPGQHRKSAEPIFYAPADSPPDHAMPDINWAWRDMTRREFAQRTQRFRNMVGALHHIKGTPLSEFSGDRYLATMSALMISFKQVKDEFGTLDRLLETTQLPRQLIAEGTFRSRGSGRPVTDVAALAGTNLGGTLLDVHAYELLPPELKDYLNLNLLLIAQQHNPFRAAVELRPKDFRRPVDERYLEFYERLAQQGISGVVSMSSVAPFMDSWLGIFDKDALRDRRRDLFPQYKGVPALDDIVTKGTEVVPPQWRRDFSRFGILYQYRTELPGEDAVDKMLDDEAKKGAIPDDEARTTEYRRLVSRLAGGGAVYWDQFAEDMQRLKAHLNPDQQALLGYGVMQHIISDLKCGQLRNLEGLGSFGDALDVKSTMILPQVAARLRMYHDAFEDDPHYLESLLHSRTSGGYLTDKIWNIKTERDRDFERWLPPSELERMQRSRPRPHYANTELHVPHQEVYMAHALQAVQEKLSGFKVDERIVCELFEYGELVFTMLGRNYLLYDLDDKTSVFLVEFMEHNIGRELPYLRYTLANRNQHQKTRDAIKSLKSYAPGNLLPPAKQ